VLDEKGGSLTVVIVSLSEWTGSGPSWFPLRISTCSLLMLIPPYTTAFFFFFPRDFEDKGLFRARFGLFFD